jgi:chitin disaccharide deacetylase
MKYVIVNADDLGASPGVNRGIIEAHLRGIVTSASLMVDTRWSAEAAALARTTADLSVGLHVVLPPGNGAGLNPGGGSSTEDPRHALESQCARFVTLMGRPPTHLDSHRNVHRDARLLPAFIEFSRRSNLPLRGEPPVRYFPSFYGQWGGQSHPEQISLESLARMLKDDIGEGITELSCHPGYVDAQTLSAYGSERELEMRTLCDPRIHAELEAQGVTLVSYHDLGRLAALGVGR